MQVAGAGVVAEPGPQGQHRIERALGQVRQGREAGHEALEVGDDHRHLGLLEHDLGDPDPVGGGVALPGQVLAARAGRTSRAGRRQCGPVRGLVSESASVGAAPRRDGTYRAAEQSAVLSRCGARLSLRSRARGLGCPQFQHRSKSPSTGLAAGMRRSRAAAPGRDWHSARKRGEQLAGALQVRRRPGPRARGRCRPEARPRHRTGSRRGPRSRSGGDPGNPAGTAPRYGPGLGRDAASGIDRPEARRVG